ncbi:unnamed protein product [Leptosia nina]|uniref:Uncharacterized protein n=1 Tax=Leptosia nina TaxID=320188 RepID=A0AAV1JQY7_9NEOP
MTRERQSQYCCGRVKERRNSTLGCGGGQGTTSNNNKAEIQFPCRDVPMHIKKEDKKAIRRNKKPKREALRVT